MVILNEELENYMMDLIPERSKTITKMEDYALKEDFPIVGPLVGQFLKQCALMTETNKIFELGSGFGYSAMWFASGTSDGTTIFCTDYSEENKEKAEQFFEEEGYEDKIEFIVGNGLEILEQREDKFDIIFCDIKKSDYPKAFEIAIPKLRDGGLLITDNTLWSAKVLEIDPKDEDTKGVKKFNSLIFNDPRITSTIVPIRDGVSVSRKVTKAENIP